MGIELEAMLNTYLKYGDSSILDYCTLYADTMISPKGEIKRYNLEDYNLDNVRTGHFIARLYQLQPSESTGIAIQTLLKQLDEQPRTKADAIYWHKAIYSYQVWLDGIFMGLPFRVLAAPMFKSTKKCKKIFDDAVSQVKATYTRTLDPTTGLNRHAWDETRKMFWADPITGLSQHCWGRAQGWYTMALIELLDALPEDYARRGEVIDLLRRDLEAVVRWQDSQSGLWYQVMDAPPLPAQSEASQSAQTGNPSPAERQGNYLEATCSSMFAYALLKAARKGYVNDDFRKAGERAFNAIVDRFIRVNADSTISLTNCCSVAGLGPGLSPEVLKAAPKVKENRRRDGSFAYYLSEPIRDNDAKGIGPFIWASLEMEALKQSAP